MPAVAAPDRVTIAAMRTLAIDYGLRRIGLALSDAGGTLATPHDVIPTGEAAVALPRLIDREGVERLVVGLPLNMDGSLSPMARQTAAWAQALADKTTARLVFVDERLTSFDAETQLTARRAEGEPLTHKRKKNLRDALAAATFLQEFLDGRLPPIEPLAG